MSHALKVPPVLQQKCTRVNGCSSRLSRGNSSITHGKILVWRGEETKYFWTMDNYGKFVLHRYLNGGENVHSVLIHYFAPTATISDAVYYPASERCHGVAVAVEEYAAAERGHYVAYFSLRTFRLLKCFTISHPITSLLNVLDGTAPRAKFQELCQQFRSGWRDILLVGCRFGQAYLFNLGVTELDVMDEALERQQCFRVVRAEENGDEEEKEKAQMERAKPKRTIPLTKMFLGQQMFIYHADDGRQICVEKEKVYVSALHYLEKSKAVMIGFSFGGVIIVSLATSKIITSYFGDGVVKFFAVQEPEEDPRPILYYWACLHTPSKGPMMVLSAINFPKDEAATKNPAEYTFLEPVPYPILKWYPDNCTEMISVRTLFMDKRKTAFPSAQVLDDQNVDDVSKATSATSTDTSLLLMVWQQRIKADQDQRIRIHGSLFDLNAFYAKRLTPRMVVDNTVARQYPFMSRFSSEFFLNDCKALDAIAESVFRFPAPAFLKDSIDQLFYPSTFYITFDLLTTIDFSQIKVQPIQTQLISELTENIESYFENPTEPSKWICAVGLANSAPAAAMNEERACLLRVLIHIFMPAVMRLITTSKGNAENLKYIQRWIWKEIELTKTKFDDLCSPLFVDPAMELSPNARGYIHHARAFFRRATLVLEALSAHVDVFDDSDWKRSISLQFKAARQVEMFSLGIAFGLCYDLLPLKGESLRIHAKCVESMKEKFVKAKIHRNDLEIRKLVDQMMQLNPEESVWQGMTAESWFPPEDFTNFLPVLLFINVPESLKISLWGYYCLEFNAAMTVLGADMNGVQKNLFEKCCSFFMQDNFSLELQYQIYRMWYDDRDAAQFDAQPAKNGDKQGEEDEKISEEELYWLPLCTRRQIVKAKAEYLKHEYGIHMFNRDVIEKRRFELIIEPPAPTNSPEPEFVTNCREKYAEIRAKFPWIFMRVDPLPPIIVKNFRARLAREAKERREKRVHVATRKRPYQQKQIAVNIEHVNDGFPLVSKKAGYLSSPFDAKRRKITRRAGNGILSDGEDQTTEFASDDGNGAILEELPLTIATPAKRQRLMFFSVSMPTAAANDAPNTPSGDDAEAQKSPGKRVSIVEWRGSNGIGARRGQTQEALKSIGRSPFVMDSPLTKSEIKSKDWDRVNRLIQTPISLKKRVERDDEAVSRIPIRLQGNASAAVKARRSPFRATKEKGGATSALTRAGFDDLQPSDENFATSPPRKNDALLPPTPASILKTDKKKSKLSGKTRLRFENKPQTEQIPSRAENLMEEINDNSFTNFGVLTESSSSSTFHESFHQDNVLEGLANISPKDLDISPTVSHKRLPRRSKRNRKNLPAPHFEEQDEKDVSND